MQHSDEVNIQFSGISVTLIGITKKSIVCVLCVFSTRGICKIQLLYSLIYVSLSQIKVSSTGGVWDQDKIKSNFDFDVTREGN